MPGGSLYLYGDTLSACSTTSIAAQQVTFASSNGKAITIAAGDGSGVNGYVVSANLLNNTSAGLVQIGNGGSASISVLGVVDLSQSHIREVFAYSSVGYAATGSTTLLAPNMTYYVNAGTINTGSITGGAEDLLISYGALVVDGKVQANRVILDGNPVIYSPISFEEIASTFAPKNVIRYSSTEFANVWQESSSNVGLAGNDIVILHGEAILNARESFVARTVNCVINVAKGAVVRLFCTDATTVIQVLHDDHAGSVKVVIDDKDFVKVDVGRELAIYNLEKSTTAHIRREGNLARRSRSSAFFNSKGGDLAEFSLVSLSTDSALIRELFRSPRRCERAVAARILRTNACLNMCTTNHGAFSTEPSYIR